MGYMGNCQWKVIQGQSALTFFKCIATTILVENHNDKQLLLKLVFIYKSTFVK